MKAVSGLTSTISQSLTPTVNLQNAENGRSPFSKEIEHLIDYNIPIFEKDADTFVDQITNIASDGKLLVLLV